MCRVNLLEPRARHVGIDLSSRQTGVAEQHLYGAQIGTVIQQVGSEGVAQGVR
jgi:hypothetical protein